MTRLAILVEGQTEEDFVNKLLVDHLGPLEVYPAAMLISGRGGNISVERLVPKMAEFSWRFDAVTSLVDFYGFRNRGERSVEELEEHLSQEINRKNLGMGKVFPYVQKYEFEGLLFSDTSAFQVIADVDERDVTALAKIRENFTSPEDINDGYETAPSKCIMRRIRRYDKVVYGVSVAQETGLAKIREKCPRFGAWLTRLEQLSLPVRTGPTAFQGEE